MLFSIILRAKGLKGIVSAVKTSYEEAVLRINEDGVLFYESHAGSPTITTMMWKKENLQGFGYTSKEEKIIGFRTDDFDKILKRCKADDDITILYNDDSGFLSVKSGDKSWELRIISPDVLHELKEPNIPHVTSRTVSISEFKDILADIGVFSKSIHFIVNDSILYFKSSGTDGKAKSQFADNHITSGESMIDVEYSLEYINDIINAVSGIFDTVKISFGDKKPLLLEFELEGFGVLKYYLGRLQI